MFNIGILTVALLAQQPEPSLPPGARVMLVDWFGKATVVVTIENISAGPTTWVDGNGLKRNEVAITYRDPAAGRQITTLAGFVAHIKTVPVPVGPPVPLHDLDVVEAQPPPPPLSNQRIKDGVRRPDDQLHDVPLYGDYYSKYRERAVR